MDSSLTTFIPPTQLQNPNAELHSITSPQPSKTECILRRRAFKRQSKFLSKLHRNFRSLLSFSPTTESNPKLEVQRRCWTESQEFLRNATFDVEGGEGESIDFFRGLFEKEETLREIYANDSAICILLCLVCGGDEKRKIRGSCRGLVKHACAVGNTKKVGMHRAFGRVVCEVLGWDVNEYLNICKSKVGDKSMKLKKMKVSPVRYRSNVLRSDVATMCYNLRSPFQRQVMPVNRSCNEMDLDKNDFQVAADNRDKLKGYDEIVEKIQQLNFNSTFSATECKKLQSSVSFDGTNNCSKGLKSTTNSFSQMMSTGRTGTSSHFGTLGPTVGECIERLKSLHGLCPGSELFDFACNLMGSNENREIFMGLGDDMARYTWLEFNYNKDGRFKS